MTFNQTIRYYEFLANQIVKVVLVKNILPKNQSEKSKNH